MKIAVMTWFHYRNYGTALQVAALSEFLRRNGYEVDIINYLPQRKGNSYIPSYHIKDVIKRKNFLKRGKKTKAKYYREYISAEKEVLFQDFLSKRITMTRACKTLSDLQDLNNEYDAFICGSDQIWAPNIFDPHYFLDFISDDKRIISYAPSVGLISIEDKYVAEAMKALINRFTYLSVREQKGAELIKNLTGKIAEVTADPTLLLDAATWRMFGDVKENVNEPPYVAVYFLGKNEEHWKAVYDYAHDRNLVVKVIPVHEGDLKKEGSIDAPIGPSEFLSILNGAEYVCTDSFHGTLFSILFQKNFSVFERFAETESINQNSRIYNILSLTGLERRLVRYGGMIERQGAIDFAVVEHKLANFVNNSKGYLLGALESVQKEKKKTIRHILENHSLCCGCGACAYKCPADAITIKLDEDGFWRANVYEDKCIGCGICRSVCVFEQNQKRVEIKSGKLYSYKDLQDSLLKKSSSGGFGYRMAEVLIQSGYAVIGCTFDTSAKKPRHVLVESVPDLKRLQGSKYMQSYFSDTFLTIKNCSKPIAVIGTPCQVAATKAVFSDRNDIVYIDLICHGVPSANLLDRYMEHLNKHYSIKRDSFRIDFRWKEKGWREIYIYTTDGDKSRCFSQKDDLYFRAFESMNCYMESCYECKWRDCSEADLRMGDYWGPRFEKDKTGVSMVVSLTSKGEQLIESLKEKKKGVISEQPIEDYCLYQQMVNITKPLYYEHIMKSLREKKELQLLVDKYVAVNERIPRSRRERILRVVRLIINDNILEKERPVG